MSRIRRVVRFVLVPLVVGAGLLVSAVVPGDDTIWNVRVGDEAAAHRTVALATDTIWN
ncbi:hypothetical protein SAMN05216371_3923 [Streptomyces sp. TLI_053]|nr:hypothetical protein SAMN05216371_3923 [Streptomyces sp. TLI_053]